MSKGHKRAMPKGWLIHPRQVDDWLDKVYRLASLPGRNRSLPEDQTIGPSP